jgi:hypothetical protein
MLPAKEALEEALAYIASYIYAKEALEEALAYC